MSSPIASPTDTFRLLSARYQRPAKFSEASLIRTFPDSTYSQGNPLRYAVSRAKIRKSVPASEHSGFEMNSKMVLLSVGVVLLLAGALTGYLYGVNSAPAKTTTTVSITTTTLTSTLTSTFTSTFTAPSTSLDAYEQVSNSFASHMLFISERNPFAIVSQYEENATVTWTGAIDGLQGFYNGTGVIFLLMNASFIGRAGSFSVGNVTRSVVDMSADSAVVNSSFDISGQNYFDFPYYYPGFNGTVSAQDSYVYSASQSAWLISTETWNFFNFTVQHPPPTTG
jgi:hypothetical protein